MNLNINTKRLRYIVPFSIEVSGNSTCRDVIAEIDESVDEFGGTWYQTSVRNGEQDIYEYILDSFDESGYSLESNIGAAFTYVPSKEKKFPSIKYQNSEYNDSISAYEDKETADFNIVDMGMYLFNTGIGLLWYEISDINLNTEQLSVFNFHFKELNIAKNYHYFKSDYYDYFIMGDYISRILKVLGVDLKYYSSRLNLSREKDSAVFVPDKAILFNYIVFDKNEEVLGEVIGDNQEKSLIKAAYYFSKGYKSTYKVLPDIEKNMYHPFQNAYWNISKEGAGFYLVDSDDNHKFYTADKGLYQKVMNDYFLIYIIVLQQEYTLLKYAEMIGKNLTANPDKYLDSELYDENEEKNNSEFIRLEREVRRLTTEVNVFLTKNVRASVSYVQVQNELYLYARNNLNVLNDIKDLTLGLDSLQGLLHDSKQQWESDEEEKRDKRINTTLGLFTVVAFVSAVYDCESLVKDFFMSQDGTSATNPLMWTNILPYGIVFLLLVIFWFIMIGRLGKQSLASVGKISANVQKKIKYLFNWGKEAELKKLKQQNEAIREEASRDSLTNCYNKKGLSIYSKKMLNEAKKKRKNMFVCSIDLNGLKHINDTYGHAEGDRAIKEIADALMKSVPDSAKVFRTGGDEFQVLGVFDKNTNLPNEIFDGFNKSIHELNNKSGLEYKINASYGWEMYIPEKTQLNIDEMFRSADKKMYEMKVKTDEYRRD